MGQSIPETSLYPLHHPDERKKVGKKFKTLWISVIGTNSKVLKLQLNFRCSKSSFKTFAVPKGFVKDQNIALTPGCRMNREESID